jgi:hypothetical protein
MLLLLIVLLLLLLQLSSMSEAHPRSMAPETSVRTGEAIHSTSHTQDIATSGERAYLGVRAHVRGIAAQRRLVARAVRLRMGRKLLVVGGDCVRSAREPRQRRRHTRRSLEHSAMFASVCQSRRRASAAIPHLGGFLKAQGCRIEVGRGGLSL